MVWGRGNTFDLSIEAEDIQRSKAEAAEGHFRPPLTFALARRFALDPYYVGLTVESIDTEKVLVTITGEKKVSRYSCEDRFIVGWARTAVAAGLPPTRGPFRFRHLFSAARD